MSSFYDDASLVVIPSGYKTSKVYAEKPTDGSGDLAFTRTGDTATRVNSAGLIERVRTNLALQSQTFDNASWYKEVGNSATANTIANPLNGAVDADTITATATNAMNVNQLFTAAVASEYTYSIYLKKNNHDLIQPYIFSVAAGGFVARIEINLSNGTFTTINGSGATVTSVGSGWYRVTLIAPFSTTNVFTTGFLTLSTTGSRSVYVFGAQLETGVATPYIATTTAAVSVGPVANVPRLDYLGSTCPRLLLEPQRTNLALYSEQFNNAAWDNNSGGVLVTANNTIAPDGTQSADKIENNPGSANSPWILQFFSSLSGGQNYVYSIYARAATAGTKRLGIWNNSTTWSYQNISVTTEWKRFEFPFVANAAATQWAVGMEFNTGETEYFVWGCQLEQGAYSTSLIPTLAATATRGADACSKTGISSLIGQTEGVLFIDMEFRAYDNQTKWLAFLGTGSQYIGFYTDNFSRFIAEVAIGGAQFSSQTFTFSVGQRYKLALAYKANDFAFYANGVQIATDNSGTVPATSEFSFEYNNTANNLTARTYNQALLFKTRLTNAELAELTTL